MPDNQGPKGGDYDVGYGKPPTHTRFVPGQSGFKGRRKKLPETHAEMIARVRDEYVTVNGKEISKFELTILSVFNQTIKSGKSRDLKLLLDILKEHGAAPAADLAASWAAQGDAVCDKLFQVFDRTVPDDPPDVVALDRANVEEARIVMACPCCGPVMRKRWRDHDYAELRKRYRASALHGQILKDGSFRVKI